MEKAHLRCIRKLTRFSTRHINWVICLPQKAGQRPRGPRLFSLQQMLIIQGIHGAFCTNTADCFWLWINLFTAHSHGHILYGSYMALLHGTDQIYNSGLEVQGFPSRLGVFLFFQWWVWWELRARGGVRGDWLTTLPLVSAQLRFSTTALTSDLSQLAVHGLLAQSVIPGCSVKQLAQHC